MLRTFVTEYAYNTFQNATATLWAIFVKNRAGPRFIPIPVRKIAQTGSNTWHYIQKFLASRDDNVCQVSKFYYEVHNLTPFFS